MSTDGTRSFVTLLYRNLTRTLVVTRDILGTIGFNAGDQRRSDTVARGELVKSGFAWNNTFRIDGGFYHKRVGTLV